jgi:hypothetical protein
VENIINSIDNTSNCKSDPSFNGALKRVLLSIASEKTAMVCIINAISESVKLVADKLSSAGCKDAISFTRPSIRDLIELDKHVAEVTDTLTELDDALRRKIWLALTQARGCNGNLIINPDKQIPNFGCECKEV